MSLTNVSCTNTSRTSFQNFSRMSLAVALVIAPIAAVAIALEQASAQEAAKADKPVELKVGDEAPEFESIDDTGELWKSIDHVGEKVLVVYFYPKDMTPGCTKQACNYRDAHTVLTDKEVEVVGVSTDSVESHQAFKKAHDLNFTLLSDPKGELARAFGVEMMERGPLVLASRWTFVIDLEGHVAYKDDEVDAAKDTENVMKVIEGLEKES
jgi:thioredoxin-dependent peroxiredoxin